MPRCVTNLGLTAAIMLVALMLTGCCSSCPERDALPMRPAAINHLAFFKLIEPDEADELIADCDQHLATIPGVQSYYCGKHLDVGRSNIDGDYDVGFFVGFDSTEDYQTYVNHPDHIMVVEKWKPRWEWIRVHDVFDPSP